MSTVGLASSLFIFPDSVLWLPSADAVSSDGNPGQKQSNRCVNVRRCAQGEQITQPRRRQKK
jgi:hypothetical protein